MPRYRSLARKVWFHLRIGVHVSRFHGPHGWLLSTFSAHIPLVLSVSILIYFSASPVRLLARSLDRGRVASVAVQLDIFLWSFLGLFLP